MIQYKHIISFNQQFDTSKIELYWYQRKTITQSTYASNYTSPRIIRSNDIITGDMVDFDTADDNTNNDDDNVNVLSNNKNNNKIISYHNLESNNELDKDRISYSF